MAIWLKNSIAIWSHWIKLIRGNERLLPFIKKLILLLLVMRCTRSFVKSLTWTLTFAVSLKILDTCLKIVVRNCDTKLLEPSTLEVVPMPGPHPMQIRQGLFRQITVSSDRLLVVWFEKKSCFFKKLAGPGIFMLIFVLFSIQWQIFYKILL